MKNCPVCNTINSSSSSVQCQTCRWPLKFVDQDFRDAKVKQVTLNWAKSLYGQLMELMQDPSVRSNTSTHNRNNVQLLEPDQDIDELRSELKILTDKMNVVAGDRDVNAQKISQLSSRIDELGRLIQSQQSSFATFNAFIEQQKAENQKLNSQCQATVQAFDSRDKLIQEQQKKISRIDTIERILKNPRTSSSASIDEPRTERLRPVTNSSNLSFSSEEIDLISEYNQSIDDISSSLSEVGNNVSIESEAFARLWDGDDSNLTFKSDRKGNYLIVRRGGYSYLVPNKQRKIISQIYTTTKALYNCEGYNEQYQKFELIKPALVAEDAIDRWRLTQKGVLEFT
jgi:uncharacterized coiled-coil protein SlyX